MNFFVAQPEDLEYSMPLEPMRLEVVGEQEIALKSLLSSLVVSHPKKLTKDQRHKFRDCYRVILLNVIYNSIRGTYTGISLANRAYDKGNYWHSLGLTYKFTKAAIERLNADGYITVFKGFYNHVGGFGRITRIYGTEKLSEAVEAPLIGDHLQAVDDTEVIVLKGFLYGPEELPDNHHDLVRLRAINTFLEGFKWPQKGPMKLVYSGGPVRGGRVFSRFQNMPRNIRAELTINRQPTVELDYKSNHLMMLLAGHVDPLPNDPYTDIALLASTTREKVKEFMTASLGADNEDTAFNALKRRRVNRERFNALKEATLTAFPSIKGALFKDMGAMLQSLEGQIALDIMYEGVMADIPVLPVHDSFITTVDHEDWLREQMYVQWMKHVKDGVKTRIDKK
ncbi:hypothetical protein B9Z35_10340 [Limnohabitans sp. Jir61]|uniref:hypothetical protein n=1 Tax=Limnohabitans sp. Jir61 TaxID=1826168 RepID=UPI000D39D03A|nr:hypothetical protein [Limnohabitans sp. Jir61]PUE29579.1 hypothetical protein B9Z35_10340 [Limnohabitans sp. Jir61]